MIQRVLAMGLTPGSRWRIVQNGMRGPGVLEEDETRLGIGLGIAKEIIVRIIR